MQSLVIGRCRLKKVSEQVPEFSKDCATSAPSGGSFSVETLHSHNCLCPNSCETDVMPLLVLQQRTARQVPLQHASRVWQVLEQCTAALLDLEQHRRFQCWLWQLLVETPLPVASLCRRTPSRTQPFSSQALPSLTSFCTLPQGLMLENSIGRSCQQEPF